MIRSKELTGPAAVIVSQRKGTRMKQLEPLRFGSARLSGALSASASAFVEQPRIASLVGVATSQSLIATVSLRGRQWLLGRALL